ncbi:MAG: S8 family serine peptidase [Candidatus Zixiibacteriota bacterium]
MRLPALAILLSTGLLAFNAPAHAGQLDPDLAEVILNAPADSLISVWIETVTSHDAKDLKRSVASRAATPAEQHAIAWNELKHAAREQDGLVEHLNTLKARGRAERVKGHWIVNVVEAEIAADQFALLAKRNEIVNIYLKPTIALVEPLSEVEPAPQSPDSAMSNLQHIRAREAWAAGYTGAGRLICSFDTGVNGLHPALYSRWKGHDGDSAAAWFDPVMDQPFPHYFSYSPAHGTHTMGIMVGADPTTFDTVGVAPGAKWISAAVIDIPGASILDAFEWAADPDGNPNTVADVPDVINHSWGYTYISCLDIFYDAVDNTEAMGIVNIFSAGNVGPNQMTIVSPADRALDSIDCFAVGNLNHAIDQLAGNSSRGPSPCDALAIKPNVVAPGTSIRSCWYNYTTTRYNTMSGTSQAAPHVSGLVALLRQKNPNATVDEIKTAILTTTRRVIAWGGMPNNLYGWGEIDCLAALNALSSANPTSHLRVYDFDHAPILPGDTVRGAVLLQNLGALATSVTARLLATNSALTILDPNLTFGNIAQGSIVRSTDSLTVVVADTVTDGTLLSADFQIQRGAVNDTVLLHFITGDPPDKMLATHSGSRIRFTLSDFGAYGFGPMTYPFFPLPEGVGFTFDGLSNDLFEGGLMIGTGYSKVSSGVHSYLFEPDMDFKVAPSGQIQYLAPGPIAPQQTWAMFNDSNAKRPLGVLVTQESFLYDTPNDDFVILRYILKNVSGATLSNLHVGLFMDWDLSPNVNSNAGAYEPVGEFVWQAYYNGSTYSRYRGIKLLVGPQSAAGVIDFDVYRHWPPITEPQVGDGYSTDEKFGTMVSGFLYADINRTERDDCFSIVAAGPMTLANDQVDTVTFAVLAGTALEDVRDAALRAEALVTDVDDDPGDPTLPREFVLHQNYPNPFNPSTTISFDLPRRSRYRLEILNVLGQTLYEVESEAPAGRHDLAWDGAGYATGAYFYRLTVSKRSWTRKMMLLK